ncbi:hypothetical protein LSTR_LSTR013039 [Laodelphax striatellus]|uniref:MICOS complex subunit n=1 Tax=Laodelphax striatellus TaxID=195883 RepID=A0A482WP66_LAOST|nr:hypothetical protein LSTR_LSTR013039 [Laodelphax striatellus]
MYNLKLLRRVIVPAGAGVGVTAALFTVSAAKPVDPSPPPPPADCDPSKTLVRPRDLPIYSTDPPSTIPCYTEPSSNDPNSIIDVIALGRRELLASLGQLEKYHEVFWDTLRTGKAHTEASLEMLRAEENAMIRYGAIGGSGFVGLLLSIRKGKFKKLLYMSTASMAMASLCYPAEAAEYSSEAARLAKRYANIAYHFAVGVLEDMGVSVPRIGNPVDYVQQMLGLKDSVKGTGGAALLPPLQETPSHLEVSGKSSK